MNCPSCGKEMERGSLYTELGRGLFFLPPGGKVGFWDTKRSVEQHGRDCFGWARIIYGGATAQLYMAMSAAALQKDPSGVLTSLGGNRGKRRNLPCEEGGISMNCPVCGKEMEKGHVITKNSIGLFFMPGEKDLRTFYTRRNIEADGGIVLDGPMTFRYNRTWLPAWVCRGCKKIVMEYW